MIKISSVTLAQAQKFIDKHLKALFNLANLANIETIMKKVNMHEAKSQLSKLGELAWQGEKIVIAKAGKPYLDLIPHREKTEPRKPGRLKGKISIADDFDQTPDDLIDSFYE